MLKGALIGVLAILLSFIFSGIIFAISYAFGEWVGIAVGCTAVIALYAYMFKE